MAVRGIRGATTASANTRAAIITATRELLDAIIVQNQIDPADIASAWLTTTADLNAEYPAVAARELGWVDVPLLCAHEMAVPHGLPHCIRVMLHWNTPKSQSDIQHVYLHKAVTLRPDKAT